MHTFPWPIFKVLNFTSFGYSCMPDKVPVDRALTYPVASNLYRDAEELLRNLHLAPFSKPMVSLIDDFPVQQKHKGWQFGYLASNTSSQVCAPFGLASPCLKMPVRIHRACGGQPASSCFIHLMLVKQIVNHESLLEKK